MTHIDRSKIRLTSVTIRTACRQAIQGAKTKLAQNGIEFSEQRLMRECLRIALKFWRGHQGLALRNKKYNKRVGPYEILPFCTTEALRSAAWARCHHSGIALSRLMDFAIANYMPRVVEYWLRFDYHWRDKQDTETWKARYAKRHNSKDFVISYHAQTIENNGTLLHYEERTQILPWPPPLSSAA